MSAKADSLSDLSDLFGITDLLDWILSAGYHTGAFFGSLFDDSVCTSAPGLTYRHSFVQQRTMVDGEFGYYYVCEYCGQSAGEVGQEAYDDYTASLPATGYNSAGRLIWTPSHISLTSTDWRVGYGTGSIRIGGKGPFSAGVGHAGPSACSLEYVCDYASSFPGLYSRVINISDAGQEKEYDIQGIYGRLQS